MKLKLAADLSLPIEAATEVLGFLGRRGQGKSYAAQKLAELLWARRAQFVVLDPVGNWYGLRLAADGKGPGIPVPVFGGLHGDVPLEPTAGKLVADLIADRGISAVLDVSQFESDADKARFAHDFGARFYFRRKQAPAAVHLFLEECQEFIPQQPMGEEKRTLHVFQRIVKLGRNYGIGVSLISQRPQEVHKKVLNLTELLFVFQLTGPHERKAVEGWIQEKGIDEDIAAELPKLQRGAPHAWSPAWLRLSRVVQIEPKWTFDASSTPRVGTTAAARELAPIDLERIRQDMAATIERAKAEDPRELRRQIAELKRQLQNQQNVDLRQQVVEKPVLTDADRKLLSDVALRLAQQAKRAAENIGAAESRLEQRVMTASAEYLNVVRNVNQEVAENLARRLERAGFQKVVDKLAAVAPSRPLPGPTLRPAAPLPKPVLRRTMTPRERTPAADTGHVQPARQRILNALAFVEGIGLASANKTQLALLSDARPTSGAYFNNLGALRSAGLIVYPTAGTVALTDDGRAIASTNGVPQTSDELHQALRGKLPPAKWRIVEEAIRRYPDAIRKEDLAERCGARATSGAYFNNLGSLRSLGLIDYPQPGYVVATPVLFLESRLL